ncbi:IS110 family transposase [Amycolatopsis lurida]|uniref:IS110 family transposase n=1 Tax=Amycolatopsis lurida TaxID=31959 RepID=UPI001F524B0D|nr:IS110 family transposase [Amycolatopsis lurida]
MPLASWNGTAPLEASSGDRRHRWSRAGNRRINRVLHVIAIVQLRHDTSGRVYDCRCCHCRLHRSCSYCAHQTAVHHGLHKILAAAFADMDVNRSFDRPGATRRHAGMLRQGRVQRDDVTFVGRHSCCPTAVCGSYSIRVVLDLRVTS